MAKPDIYFRADGGSSMGLGHIIRSCALAQMLRDQFRCSFIGKGLLPELKKQVADYCDEVIEIDPALTIEEEASVVADMLTGRQILVTDGYHFDTAYQRTVTKNRNLLVCIDDIYACHYISDALINHAGGVIPAQYSAEWYTRFYLGTDYALLRKPFYQSPDNDNINTNDNVLVNLGGADPVNDLKTVLTHCLDTAPQFNYHVAVGPAYQHLDWLNGFMAGRGKNVTIYRNLTAEEMAALMKQCSMAVTSPSTVSYEYLAIGGKLFLYTIADNQKGIFSYFISQGMAYDFSQFPQAEKSFRLKGDFVKNLRNIFLKLHTEASVDIRRAKEDDAERIYNWINDPEVRKQSYSAAPVAWEDHLQWFTAKLQQDTCYMYLLHAGDDYAGQIRFDIKNNEATISYLVSASWRGRGMGTIVLKKGIRQLLREDARVTQITGFVKETNPASCSAFENLNFKKEAAEAYPGSFKYTLNAEQ
ncbi:UDP-2,4-diacetamido-2,4,6-trideoxy-beta-L-altropyranose hydrolase [Nostoc ellipsosporum NOK]|nr:UDP-2,4-diacetamido-2,4,6-trideoxy-beta-L-altropyranose hydrolase [Nostoc ellipsosporum NOK]